MNRSSNGFLRKVGIFCSKFSFFLDKLGSLLKRTKYYVSSFSFYINNEHFFLFFVKLCYLTCFFLVLSLSYSLLFPTIEVENFARPFQVFLQLSLYLLHFRFFTTKEEKEAKWLLIISAFYSVVATLFLKNVVSLEGLLFIMVPLFCFFILCLPSDVLPFAILLFYSLEKGLAQWAFFLLFQLIAYYTLCLFLEARPKQSIFPLILLLIYFYVLGKGHYSEDFLHEPARLLALVSGACIIFLCFKKRERIGFIFSFFVYFISSTTLGIISIASAPGGDNISCPIPFLFILCHLFIFFGLLLFQRTILPAKQPLVPLIFGALLYFLPHFPNLEWLEGWIEGLDLFLLLLGLVLFICGEENE